LRLPSEQDCAGCASATGLTHAEQMQRQEMLAGAVSATKLAHARQMHRQGMLAGAESAILVGPATACLSNTHCPCTLSSCSLCTHSYAQQDWHTLSRCTGKICQLGQQVHAWASHIALVSPCTLSSCNLETLSYAQACCGWKQLQASSSRSSTSACQHPDSFVNHTKFLPDQPFRFKLSAYSTLHTYIQVKRCFSLGSDT